MSPNLGALSHTQIFGMKLRLLLRKRQFPFVLRLYPFAITSIVQNNHKKSPKTLDTTQCVVYNDRNTTQCVVFKRKSGSDEKLKTCRHEKNSGLTQSYVAENVGITVTSYQRIEYGKQRPTLTTAIKIAEVLHSTVEELFK